ncbi:MAG: NAD(P)-dependent oxidoreductase [Carbonactinosporaceae bacterium]
MTQMTEPVGFLGLGTMGLPMATRLVEGGHDVVAWNRSGGPARRLADRGGRRAATPREVAERAGVVLTMLPDLPEVRSVLDGPDGVLAGMRPAGEAREVGAAGGARTGKVVVVHGTTEPAATRELAGELRPRGVHLVDAPVSGGDVGAAQGRLSIMAGGDPEDFRRVLPYFLAMGDTVRHLGPVGTGALVKACNQIAVGVALTGLAEAVLLAERAGLDRSAVLDVLAGGLAGGRSAYQHKDLGFALAAADQAGVELPTTRLVVGLYERLCDAGHGDLDHSAVLLALDREPGGPPETQG